MSTVPWDEKRVAEELRQRLAAGESIGDVFTWRGKSAAEVGEVVDLLQQHAGLSREGAEHEVANHPDWAPLVQLLGGMAGEELPPG